MNFIMIILSFCAGIFGTFLGGTQTFICTGFVGLIVSFLTLSGYNVQFLNDFILNVLFLIFLFIVTFYCIFCNRNSICCKKS